ncbi:hypothetical protein ATO1_23865 [Phaeobacter sp. 22II1-1F12B]|nr:hypothetical protein ATO1_23865 [Phaeobacter sp. 22II1-1F12B]
MRKFLILLLASGLVLSACGNGARRAAREAAIAESGGNPLIPAERNGMFSKPEEVDTSVLIGTISELRIERTLSGAIVHVTGVADRQGAYRAELRPEDPDLLATDGVLSFAFRVRYPVDPTPIGSTATRTVYEAFSLSSGTLQNVRTIRVTGAQNSMQANRR